MARMLDPMEADVKCGIGAYVCRVVDFVRDHTKQKGTEFWGVTVRVIDGPASGADVQDAIYLTDKTMGNVRSFMRACGLTDPVDLDNPEALYAALIGRTLQVTFKDEESEGKQVDPQTGKPRIFHNLRFEYNSWAAVDKKRFPDGGVGIAAPKGEPDVAADDSDLPF